MRSLSRFPSFELSRKKRAAHLSSDTWPVVPEGSLPSLREDAENTGWERKVAAVVGASFPAVPQEGLQAESAREAVLEEPLAVLSNFSVRVDRLGSCENADSNSAGLGGGKGQDSAFAPSSRGCRFCWYLDHTWSSKDSGITKQTVEAGGTREEGKGCFGGSWGFSRGQSWTPLADLTLGN